MAATALGGGVSPTSSALAARALPQEHHGKAYAVLASARALAAVFGPAIGSHLAVAGHIRGVFLWTGALTIIVAVWAQVAVREAR